MVYAFGGIPLMELFWKPDPKNLSPEEEDEAMRQPGMLLSPSPMTIIVIIFNIIIIIIFISSSGT